MENDPSKKTSGRVGAGLFLLVIGVILLMERMGFYLPNWLFSWPMILIGIGIFIGLKHNFRGGAWFILIVIGGVFLVDFSVGFTMRRYIWPLVIIALGLFMILRPRKHTLFGGREWANRWRERHSGGLSSHTPTQETSSAGRYENFSQQYEGEDYLDAVTMFGGIRKVILTKNFKGGQAVSIFGGTDIDLSRADIQGTVSLELTQIFGGTKLIVPSHWEIKSEVVAFLGGIEDKRTPHNVTVDPTKVLLLRGTSILGGIDIRNY